MILGCDGGDDLRRLVRHLGGQVPGTIANEQGPRRLAAKQSVSLVCGDPVWEQAVRWLFGSAGFEIVSHARDVDRASDLLARSDDCVLVVDADEDVEAGRLLRRVRDLRRCHASTPVVVVCVRGDDARHDAALASGANAVVWRDDAFALLDAVEGAIDGRSPCAPERRLTLRELEILRLVAEGRTNREIARAVWVTEPTVKYHLANIYRRLEVRNRVEATTWAIEHGVVDGERATT